MNWKGILGIALTCLVLGAAGGLLVGMRGCGGGTSKLLQENAELKAEVTRHRFLASEAEKARASHATKRADAERALLASESREATATEQVARLRRRVAAAGRERDERDDLIGALDQEVSSKTARIDMLTAAVAAAAEEIELGHAIESSLNAALVASESRADKLERGLMRERPKKIIIGVCSAVGGAGAMALAVYGAGKL
jgi:chromosome segregation ATPase